jgi:hypothetical protein
MEGEILEDQTQDSQTIWIQKQVLEAHYLFAQKKKVMHN